MSPDVATKIIDQASRLGVHSIKFNWKGESTLNPWFPSITAYAKHLAHGSTFIDRLTNSNFKFPTHKDSIFDGLSNQTKVKVSFDSFRKDVLETQRAGAKYEQALANIDKFYNWPARVRSETEIVIQAVRTQLNKDEDIAGEVKRRWPEATVSIRDMVTGRVDKDLSSLESRARDTSERQPCLQASVRVIFNKDGLAFPCCPDISEKLVIGDIRKQSLKEIFNSIEARTLRKDLKSGKAFEKDPCKTCPSFETYKNYKHGWAS